MEAERGNANNLPGILYRLLPAVGPGLLIAIGYVDPGKWAATVEGGARFGFDLVVPLLIFNFAAILCQYLSACIGVVTGRDLAQICSDEYDKITCTFLGVQALLSVIALDLTMVLGTAHGLNLLFGVEMSTCVFLTALDAVLFPLFVTFMERYRANFLCIYMAGSIFLLYVLGVLTSQPEIPLSINGMQTKLSEESAFTMMSLLGASIMPHNFYLHSSIVLNHRGLPNVSKEALCYDHFFAILCIFSGIYLVNYVLINSAANVFFSTGLFLLTFADAMSLVEQVFRSPVAPFAFLLVVYLTNQITTLTWNLNGQGVSHDFLRLDLPNWLQRATIRIIAIVPALYCVWTSGVEGIYQLLIFTQVMVALLLPSSVIPLFRVASSRPIMGAYKISQLLEFLALITFMGILGLEIIFVVEMIFGHSDWVGNLRWSMGSSSSVPYVVLLITACSSFCLMLWLAATPLKSATNQLLNLDVQSVVFEPSTHIEENVPSDGMYIEGELQQQDQLPTIGNCMDNYSDITVAKNDLDLPETIMDSNEKPHLATIDENSNDIKFSSSSMCHQEPASTLEPVPASSVISEVADTDFPDVKTVRIEKVDPVERTVSMDRDVQIEKEDYEGDTWEPEESMKEVSVSSSDGPGSLRSLSGKSDDGGNGAGSPPRLVNLRRGARRQFAAHLDEFWRQLFDLHGQVAEDAKARKLDFLLVDTTGKEPGGYFPSVGGRGSDSLINSSACDSPKQLRMHSSFESSYGFQRGSPSLWSNHMQLLDAYVQGSSRNFVDSSQRRYSSVRTPPTSGGWGNQPATVHGYQISDIANRIARERGSNGLNGQMDSSASISPSLGPRNYRDPLAVALAQNLQNGLSSPQASGFHNLAASRNSHLQSQIPFYDGLTSAGSGDNSNTKKYHSLPDISGIVGPYKGLYMSEKSNQWDNTVGYRSVGGRTGSYDPSFFLNTGSGTEGSLAFDDLSKGYGDSFSLARNSEPASIWARQPYEQFGVADKSCAVGSGLGSRSNSITQEAAPLLDSEVQLLQSFRYCIVKLLKLEGSDWLFRQNDGADEDLIGRVAAKERCLYEAEIREMNHLVQMSEPQYLYSDRKPSSALRNDEGRMTVSHCGDGCVWKVDLIISFGVWCIHRILELSSTESRPELWGKYTYVLNRLQGIIELAFSKPRNPIAPCFCLDLSSSQQLKSSHGMLPPAAKVGRDKCTTPAMLLEIIKVVEPSISGRKGRSGTAAGDVAFPKGKENLASVLKRYKRRLSSMQGSSK